jgi:hypothetical protein
MHPRFPFRLALSLLVVVPAATPAADSKPVTWKAHAGWVGGLAFSPDGKTLASAGRDRKVIVHEAP